MGCTASPAVQLSQLVSAGIVALPMQVVAPLVATCESSPCYLGSDAPNEPAQVARVADVPGHRQVQGEAPRSCDGQAVEPHSINTTVLDCRLNLYMPWQTSLWPSCFSNRMECVKFSWAVICVMRDARSRYAYGIQRQAGRCLAAAKATDAGSLPCQSSG